MRRREFLKYSAATALATPFVRAARADEGTFKVVVIGAKTGPLAPGAAITQFPPFKLWAHEVNERGGLKLKDGQRKIELIEYDDHTQPAECIKAVERAATVDKADWISGMYATGFNLAVAPTLAKYGYPQFAVACLTDQAPMLVKKYPGFFTFQSSTTVYAKSAIAVLKSLKDGVQIGNKVAVKAYYSAVGTDFEGFSQKFGAAADNVLGAGGVKDSPEIRAYYKKHKEVTGVDADHWGNPLNYQMLQVLTTSIETLGSIDRDAIADYVRKNKFKVLQGEIALPGQILDKVYTVGQWQNGFFHGVNGIGFTEFTPVKVKTGWS
jgi:ABC-type branched-subunit amino acid transport system substrate-binding protein